MSRRVLVVEDEALIAVHILGRLKSFGYEALGPVPRGEAAVEVAIRERPDLVLMDIKLQGPMNGIEAARRIWAAGKIPSLFLSAFGEAFADEIQAFPGGRGFIRKPFEDEDLESSLAAVFGEETG